VLATADIYRRPKVGGKLSAAVVARDGRTVADGVVCLGSDEDDESVMEHIARRHETDDGQVSPQMTWRQFWPLHRRPIPSRRSKCRGSKTT